jgi:hypothetical protein
MVTPQAWKSGHDIGSAAVGKVRLAAVWLPAGRDADFVAPRCFGYHAPLA